MATEHQDETHKMGYNCISRIETVRTSGIIWYRGHVVTEHGIVGILISGPKSTRLEYSLNGLLYTRRFGRQFQPRYLTNLARKFAAEIATKETQPNATLP